MDLETILSMDLKEAYRLYVASEPEIKSSDTLMKKDEVRYGFSLHFDIYSYFSEHYSLKHKKGVIIMEGKSFPLKKFHTELETRLGHIQRCLIIALTEEEFFEPRTP